MADKYFKTAFKGYECDAVDEFITQLSDTYASNTKSLEEQIKALQSENQQLKSELTEARAQAEEAAEAHRVELESVQTVYDALCAEIGEKMVTADKRAAEIVKNAEKEAELVSTTARQKGENEAKAIRAQAEEEAARMIEETRRKCEGLFAAAEEFRKRQDEMSRSMTETEKRFGDALNRLREGISEGVE